MPEEREVIMHSQIRKFTLIELLVVIAIIAILAAMQPFSVQERTEGMHHWQEKDPEMRGLIFK